MCAVALGSSRGRCPSPGGYVTRPGATRGTAAGTLMVAVLYLASDGTLYITSSELVANGGTLAQ